MSRCCLLTLTLPYLLLAPLATCKPVSICFLSQYIFLDFSSPNVIFTPYLKVDLSCRSPIPCGLGQHSKCTEHVTSPESRSLYHCCHLALGPVPPAHAQWHISLLCIHLHQAHSLCSEKDTDQFISFLMTWSFTFFSYFGLLTIPSQALGRILLGCPSSEGKGTTF